MCDSKTPAVLVHGPRIETLDGSQPEALAVVGERVAANGSMRHLRMAFPGAESVHLEGELLVPGFNDAHCHPSINAEARLRPDVGPESTPTTDDVVDVLRQQIETTPPGEWVVATNYNPGRTQGPRLDRRLLDGLSSQHPIYVVMFSWHSGVGNSRALELAGYRTPSDSPTGGKLTSDSAGDLDGWMLEQSHMRMVWADEGSQESLVSHPDAESWARELAAEQQLMHSYGITSFCDALVTSNGWSAYDLARRTDRLSARAGFSAVPPRRLHRRDRTLLRLR